MMSQSLTLSQLNGLISLVFRDEFSELYWVTAEISELHGSHGKHLYFELVEIDATRQVVAKARATMWANVARTLQEKFYTATQQPLKAGLKVLLLVRLNFHEVYGFSLNIQDIDPAYTIGDQAQRKQQIIAQLEEDGIIDLNKELVFPRPLRSIAVISSSTAAGFGDFMHQLQEAGTPFETALFPATMQGEQTEQSVIHALEKIYEEKEKWDLVVIIRGGGATSDLSSFDTYLLAANVAQFPLPVLTGIGHERDETILDLVAYRHFKTPTAVAAFLIEQQKNEVEALQALEVQLYKGVATLLEKEKRRLEDWGRRYQFLGQSYLRQEQEKLLLLAVTLERKVWAELQHERQTLALLPLRLSQCTAQRLAVQRQSLELYEKTIALASPERILKMGYSLTTRQGEFITQAKQLQKGDVLRHRFADGEVESVVQ